ncbi:MAG: gluconokinase, partial [Deltaproteobacteria bacterium]|nr:gluconokinase [Deltaproteobacteria bacterium]
MGKPAGAPDAGTRNMEREVVLALDVGTSSVRCVAYDTGGAPVAAVTPTSRTHQPRVDGSGASELDAEPLLESAVACLAEVSAQAAQGGYRVLGVGVCTFWHSVLGVDDRDAPCTPLLLWNDTRAAGAAAMLRRELEANAVHQRTGCVLHASYLPARLRWLRLHRPELYRASRRFLSFGEFLELRLFGEPRCSLSMASGSGLLNQEQLEWDGEVLAALELEPSRLGEVAPGHTGQSGMLTAAASLLPNLRGVPFFPAIGDGAANTLGCGAVGEDEAALMIGTSAALRRFIPGVPRSAPPPPRGLWRYLLDDRRALIGGALSNGGNLFAWMTSMLRLPPEAALEAELVRSGPGSHGLTVLPFLAGERNPDYPDDATGVIVGVRQSTTPAHMAQAGMEAVAYRLAAIAERMEAAGEPLRGFLASGGVLRSQAWPRMLADVLGRPVTLSRVAEASSR